MSPKFLGVPLKPKEIAAVTVYTLFPLPLVCRVNRKTRAFPGSERIPPGPWTPLMSTPWSAGWIAGPGHSQDRCCN